MTELILQTQEQKVDRATGIGSSEIAAIVGINPYQSAFDIWIEKTGKLPKEFAQQESEAAKWGKILQQPIAAEYARRTKKALVFLFDEPIRHGERSWQISSPDAIVPSENLDVEIKAPGLRQAVRYGDPGTDQIPDEHFVQVQWQLSTLGYEHANLVVLLGGQDFRIYNIARDRALEAALLSAGFEFWTKHVQADKPPPISATDTTHDYLKAMFPKNRLALRDATTEEMFLVTQYAAAKAIESKTKEDAETLGNALRFAIGEHEGLACGRGVGVTWKLPKPSLETDWRAAFIEFRNQVGLLVPASVHDELSAAIDEIVKDNTTEKPGARRLLIQKGKK